MRYIPSRRALADGWAPDFFDFGNSTLMRTDIHEKDGRYLLDISMPGFDKQDIKVTLDHGTLTVSAQHHENRDNKDSKGTIIRQERYEGSASRSWYVGENVRESDIHASYKDGVLSLDFPSNTEKKEPEKHYIDIL